MDINQQDKDKIIGCGWSFPPSFNRETLEVEMSKGQQDIEESIRIISTTQLGSRLMRPDFGIGLHDRLFKGISTSEQTLIKEMIQTALLYYEPRIDVEDIQIVFAQYEGKLDIKVTYAIRDSNSRYNFVFPLYIDQNISSNL